MTPEDLSILKRRYTSGNNESRYDDPLVLALISEHEKLSENYNHVVGRLIAWVTSKFVALRWMTDTEKALYDTGRRILKEGNA